ncbi:MAG: hypothetical protein FJ191_13010 [Gammaproteobacteria bacterium]|nr:hypothetical protein [Gammaproteobacteria bacterium]
MEHSRLRAVVLKTTHLADAILAGRNVAPARVGCYKPLPADIRMLYCCAWNPLNQLPDLNHLPACTMLEREDFTTTWRDCEPHLLPQARAIEPLGQSRPDYWILDQLGLRLGLTPLRSGKSPRAWLDHLLALDGHAPFVHLVKQGGLRERRTRPWVALERNVTDPERRPFRTPSGRIELRSSVLADMEFSATSYGQAVPALPTYLENDEGPGARNGLPLQLVTTKSQHRCHSTFTGNPLLEELQAQSAWIHPEEAGPRGIAEGDAIVVFNARGRVRVVARVTERIRPGVLSRSNAGPVRAGRPRARDRPDFLHPPGVSR